jgi:competence protein ComEA
MTRLQRIALGAVLGLAVTVSTALTFFHDDNPDVVLSPPEPEGTIAVHIEGAVATPGLVTVPAGARLADVLAAAGGLRSDADVSGLNVAARVADAQRIIILRVEPTPNPASTALTSAPDAPRDVTAASSATVTSDVIDLNTADVELLETLPGIGPVLAQRIVDYRDQNGPFRSVDDLEAISGISARLIEEIRPLVTVDG